MTENPINDAIYKWIDAVEESSWLKELPSDDREEALTAISMISCPYYLFNGTCSQGCWTEPRCHVDDVGWIPTLHDLGAPGSQSIMDLLYGTE